MSFYSRFELLDLLQDGKTKIFKARRLPGGEPVSVHLLIGGPSAENQKILRRLSSLPPAAKSEIYEVGENDGTPYVVTAPWSRSRNLEEWVDTSELTTNPGGSFNKAGNWRIPVEEFGKKSDKPTTPKAANDPSFTQMFGISPMPEPPMPHPPSDPEPSLPSPDPVVGKSDFNQMFGNSAPNNLPASPPKIDPDSVATQAMRIPDWVKQGLEAPPATVPPFANPKMSVEPTLDKLNNGGPGEFTRMFQTPASAAAPTSSVPQAPTEPPKAPGEFTRIFQTPAVPVTSTAAPISPLQRPTDDEFHKFFDSSPAPASPNAHPALKDPFGKEGSAPPPSMNSPGEFTRMFGVPGGNTPPGPGQAGDYATPASATGAFQAPVRTQTPAAPPAAVSPGEYTRMFAPAAAPPSPPTAPQGDPGTYTQMFSAPAPSPIAAVPTPAAVATAPVKKANMMPLFIILGVLLLLVLALVVYFAGRK